VSLYKKLGSQTLVYGLGNIVPRMLNYAILTSYYSYRFSVEQYGVITELYAYVAILLVILTYGMETGLFKFSEGKKRLEEVFRLSLITVTSTSIVFIILLFTFYKNIASFISYTYHPEYIILLGSTVGLDAITSIVFAKLRIEEKVRKFALLKILNVVITILFVFTFLELFPAIANKIKWSFYAKNLKDIEVGWVFIANLLASFILLIVLIPEYKGIKIRFNKPLLRKILTYSLPLMVVGLAGILNETLERILLRFFLPENSNVLYEIGIYGANYRLALLMTIFIQMFRYAAEPFFFLNYGKDDSKQIYANVLKYFTLFCLIIFLFVSMYIDVLKYFISKKFHSGLNIVIIILIANMILGLLFNINMWYKLTGKTYLGMYITGIGAFVTIVLNIMFIPKYSYVACAWVHLISNSIMLVITLILGNKYYRIPYDYKRIGEFLVVAMLLYGLFLLLKSEIVYSNMILATVLLLGFILYCNKRENLIRIFFSKRV
jgi:O-antigen/teichoic acid export membrane protein